MIPITDESVTLLAEWRKIGGDYPLRPRGTFENDLASRIEHTLLRPDTTEEDVMRLCVEARDHRFAAVCVNPIWVQLCADLLTGADVPVATVIGFPLGASKASTKMHQTTRAALSGAAEFDTVMLIGHLKSGAYEEVFDDIRAVVETAKGVRPDHIVKVIIETCLLDDKQKIIATLLAREAGADFVKTSTGFAAAGATHADVALLRFAAASRLRVKASGGIRTREAALIMLEHGADRIGTSSGVAFFGTN